MSNFNYSLEPGKKRESARKYKDYKKVISIITPTWNTEETIFQTANCILNQTFPYFEWIIVDDGSTNENSLKILKEVEKLDERITVLHKENQGPSQTRDYGAAHASEETEYFLFIDDDDLNDKTLLECSYLTLSSHPEASWCYADSITFESMKFKWNKQFSSEKMKYENLLVSQGFIRKSAFFDVGGYGLTGKGHYEDWILWLKLLAKGHIPVHLSYFGLWYRRKANSGEFSRANKRMKENLKEVSTYAKKITKRVDPIEYPRSNYDWSEINETFNNITIPKFEDNKKTNILVIIPWMVLGGADKFNLDLFKLIDKEKYSITLISTEPNDYVWRQEFEQVCDSVFDLTTFLDRKDWLAFINYIIETRNIDLIFNTNSVTGYMMLPYIRAKYPKIPILDYIHMEEWYNRNGGYSRDSSALGSVIDKTLFCNKNSENIMHDYFKQAKEKLGTVYIGVDSDKFDPEKYDKKALQKKYGITDEQFVISVIARIDYQKRPVLLMKIIKELVSNNKIKNPLFVIAGDGPLLPLIKKMAKKDGTTEYIKFIGSTSTPEEIYTISDLTLNCSIKEGLALTAYESLSMGVPVISSDVGGQKELIDNKTGVIVPCLQKESDIRDFNYTNEEIKSYVDGIEKIYANIDKYKKSCRKRILDRFTINNMVSNMENIFSDLSKLKLNDTKLSEHIDITKELLNQYFLADSQLYNWKCREYNLKLYGVAEPVATSGRKQKLAYKWIQLGIKLHMAHEFDAIMRTGYEILRNIKHIVVSTLSILIHIVKFFIRICQIEWTRVQKIFK